MADVTRQVRLWLAPCAAGAATIMFALMSRPATAQDGIIRHTPDDGEEYTLDRPVAQPIWGRYDDLVHPDHPEFGRTTLYAERLVYEIIDDVSRGAFDQAEEDAAALVKLAPDRPGAYYNYACVLALNGRIEPAFAALDKSIAFGWRNAEHLKVDDTLANLRGDARFEAVASQIAALIESERIAHTPLRNDEWAAAAADVERTGPGILERFHVPGAAVALIRDGRTVWSGAFGVADERSDDRLSADTLFRSEAAGRLLTAVLALKLHEDGVWNLDQPLATWLPECDVFATGPGRDVTPRRLLNFTAGIALTGEAGLIESIEAEITRTMKVDAGRLGSRYTFTPSSYLAAGRAMERACAPLAQTADAEAAAQHLGSFGPLVRGRVLLPLRMSRTFFNGPRRRHQIATGHTEYGTPLAEAARPLKPAAPVYTTAEDASRLIEFILGSGSDFDERARLTADSTHGLYERGLPAAEAGMGYGLGVKVIDTDFGLCAEAASVEGGMGALIRWYPDSGCGVVVLFNSETGLPAAKHIAHAALGGI